MPFVKYTETQYDAESWLKTLDKSLAPAFWDANIQKILEMELEEKTDGVVSIGSLERSWHRVWSDEAAAEEWRTHIYQNAANNGITILQYIINDIEP